ncbi:IS4 family transposase [Leptolyngbya iicbica]|uniref:IS4 family transposase n=2 Tax=Cyanophyceae TaxID=3028117 RepID=A0A4Q7EDQ3_9CYAN|nr:IS4 family transposase [Leptolyngbya sp. LK]RZM81914.1 IS4 family transposase [Leptolyngbya sp. LK]
MSKPHKRRGNPDFRRFVTPPAPSSEALEQRLIAWLTPGTFANLKTVNDNGRQLRDRTLTLSVMAALVVSLVYRQVRYLSDIVRLLEQAGLLWVPAQSVTKQAVSERFRTLPAALFMEMFEHVVSRIRASPQPGGGGAYQSVSERFSAIWIADGSTMSRLQRRLAQPQPLKSNPLAGKIMMVVEALSHRPVKVWHDDHPQRSDMSWSDEFTALLPVGGLLIVDMGFFAFPWFDAMTTAKKCFLTRLKQKVNYQVVRGLSQGPCYRDELIEMGLGRHPCEHPVRLVSVLWGQTWYRYLTNVLDPDVLSAQQVCDLYRRRWRIEEAFLLTKRLLGLAYLWVGGSNGVKIQIYATWTFYAVLNDLCAEVAIALKQPIEMISVEMVFRSLYHYAQAKQREDETELIPFLVKFHQSFGLIKTKRRRQLKQQTQSVDIWTETLT